MKLKDLMGNPDVAVVYVNTAALHVLLSFFAVVGWWYVVDPVPNHAEVRVIVAEEHAYQVETFVGALHHVMPEDSK